MFFLLIDTLRNPSVVDILFKKKKINFRFLDDLPRALSGQHSDPCALGALEPFFGNFSAARPRLVARLAPSDSPRSRGPCSRAGPPSPRLSRSASEVARSRLRGLPHAPQSQPFFFTTTSLSGSSYSGWVKIRLKLRHQAG